MNKIPWLIIAAASHAKHDERSFTFRSISTELLQGTVFQMMGQEGDKFCFILKY